MRVVWLSIVLILAAGLVYSNSFPGTFHFDDFPLLLENPRIVGPTFSYSSFLEQYAGRPLTMWTFHWNYRLFGENPASYHWVSLFLHLLVVVELFFLVYQLFGEKLLAFGCSLLFAVHPLQTQAVNYIWSRSVLLMAVFGLGTLLLARRFPLTALISFQLAIWCRSEAVILCLPLILLNRSFRRAPVALAGVNAAACVYSLLKYAPREMAWYHSDLLGYWVLQPVAFLKYLSLMIWPVGLNVDHDLGPVPLWASIGAAAVISALLILVLRLRERYPVPVLGFLWMAATLAPSLLVPNSDVLNESRAYFPLAGFTLMASWFLVRLSASRDAVGRWAVAVVPVLLLVPMTVARNEVWKDDLLLWQDSARKSPAKARPHYNLGVALVSQSRYGEAEMEFRRALEMDPEDDFSYAALAYCAELRNELGAALQLYRQALQHNPKNTYAREALDRVQGQIRG
jgi:tetratricopeptide (TPR) repeat protein